MNPFWAMLLTLLVVAVGTALCLWMRHRAHDVESTLWILEYIGCPIIRVLVLLFIVSLVYPVVDTRIDSFEFWQMLGQVGKLHHLINILFLAGLGLAFVPIANHPVFALPIQSMLTIALVFRWQYQDLAPVLHVLPGIGTLLKIIVYMALAYFVTREASIALSRLIDRRYTVAGSIRLVSDSIYLVLQVPVMLIYCGYLKTQLPA